MNEEESGSEKIKNFEAKITFNMKSQYNYHSLFAWIIIFIGYWFLPKGLTRTHPEVYL